MFGYRAARRLARRTAPVTLAAFLFSTVVAPFARAASGADSPPKPAVKPPLQMKGVPTLKPYVPLSPQAVAAQHRRPPSDTLLDEAGRLDHAVPASTVAAWKRELKTTRPRPSRLAALHLWLGEYELAANQEPETAVWHFDQTRHLVARSSRVYGRAAYDAALAHYYSGRYAESEHQFRTLLKARPALVGYSRQLATLWLRHARACAGYHDERAKMGIPEPERLDPLCAISSLAVCLKGRGLPHDKARLVAAVHHTGEGSSLADILRGASHLGLAAHVVSADETGLRALRKPLIAHVEHDHFIAVTRTSPLGVSYVCSDCGPWPGGEINLTWRQWRKLEASVFVSLSQPGSSEDAALRMLADGGRRAHGVLRLAAAQVVGLNPSLGVALRLAAQLRGHAVSWNNNPQTVACGLTRNSQHCHDYACCPRDRHGNLVGWAGHIFAATAGDPVYLATGEEEYTPEPDLTVYNPHGPSVAWGRLYNSLRPTDDTYQSDDFGPGWSHDYNLMVIDPTAHTNTQVPAGGSATVPTNGNDAGTVATYQGWDVVLNGAVVATSTSPNGWAVSQNSSGLSVSPAAGAALSANYEVRFCQYAPSGFLSGYFDVRGLNSVPLRSANIAIPATSSYLSASDRSWQIALNGTVIATNSAPHGWSVGEDTAGSNVLIACPPSAALGGGYTVVDDDYYMAYTAAFSVTPAAKVFCGAGAKYIMVANGAYIRISAGAVPTAGQPAVACPAEAGAPELVTWNYDAGTGAGQYVVTTRSRSSLTFALAKIASATYNANGAMTGTACFSLNRLADRNGNALSFVYGAWGPDNFPLLTAIQDASNNSNLLTITRAADGTGGILGVSDCYGRSVYYHIGTYATQNVSPPYATSYQQVDQVSQLVATGTANPPLRYSLGYANYPNGETNETVPFLHTIGVPSPTGTGVATATINYDPTLNVVSSTVDGNGNTAAYTEPDANHTTVTVTNPAGTVVYSYTVGFDGEMNETTRTDGAGTIVSSIAYADGNDPYKPSTITDANNHASSYTWDSFGNLRTAVSARGTTTTATWDYSRFGLGEVMQVQEGAKTPSTFSYYEPSGLLQTAHTPAPGHSGDGATVATSYTYDALGNVLTVTAPGNNAAASLTATYGYTTDGTYSQAEALGEPLTVTDNLGKTTHLRYDALGRCVTGTDPLGNRVDAAYNAADQIASVQYPATGQSGAGRATVTAAYLYTGGPMVQANATDESGVTVRQANATYGPEGETLTVTGSTEPAAFAYDALYRTAGLTDGNNQTTVYAYNQAGYLSAISYPGGGVLQCTSYDPAGNMLQRIDANGATINYTYNDPENELTAVQYAAAPAQNTGISYDQYGRISGLTDASGGQTFTYDDTDQRTSATTSYNGVPAQAVSYAFYPNGDRQTMSAPGATVSYSYDAGGRMVGVSTSDGSSASWSYLDNGWFASQQVANGPSTSYTYNAWGSLTRLANTLAGSTLSDYSAFGYDGVGNPTTVTASVPGFAAFGGTTTYGHDTRNQVTQEQSTRNGGYSSLFGYDAAGNPTTFRGATRSYNANNQQAGNTYDGNGNPTVYQGTALGFDPECRLTSVGSTWSAGYRADGLRAWKQSGSARTYFIYDNSMPVAEISSSGAVLAVNHFGMNGLYARKAGATLTTYAYDQAGNVAQRVVNGSVASASTYDAYGVGQSSSPSADPFGYGGQWGYYTDTETGLVLLSQRYYDAGAGRFLTRDPIGYGGGLDMYRYVGNHPTGAIDPNGTDFIGLSGSQWVGIAVGAGTTLLTGNPIIGFAAGTAAGTAYAHWGEHQGWGESLARGSSGALMGTEAGLAARALLLPTWAAARGINCFVAGTPVAVTSDDGAHVAHESIERIRAGDVVVARSEATGKTEAKRVTSTLVRHSDAVVAVTLADARTGQVVDAITCTPEHPWYVEGQGFTPAGRLAVGNAIVTRAGPNVVVHAVELRHAQSGYTVYNLKVEDDHTYFVGTAGGGEWVHNANCGDPRQALVDAEPVGSALKPDRYHYAPTFVRADAASNGTVFTLRQGVYLIQQPGELNGHVGRFEYIVDTNGPSCRLTHQLFVPGGDINGKPSVR